MENSAQTRLYELLVTKDFEPEMKDSKGNDINDPAQADMFTFDWKTENKNYGTVVIMVSDISELKIFFGDNLGRTMDSEDKTAWYDFLNQMKEFAIRNRYAKFTPNNLNRLKYSMQGMAAIKEGLFEGYYGNKRTSYSDQPKQTRLVIKHSRPLAEGDKRFRYVESLYVETGDDQRFKLPFTKLACGRAMARHISEGGTPYDAFGQHICQMAEEMNILQKFVRAAKHKEFNGQAAEMCESAIRHYQDLKAKAKRMISQRGYQLETENFDPAVITDSEKMAEGIRNMFIEQSLDSRIEEAIPVLARIQSQKSVMKEVDDFASWAESIAEGTWSTPDTPQAENELKKLLSSPFPVGPNAMYATEKLYDIFGDDALFDQLTDLAAQDPDADARELIQARLEELGIDIAAPADAVAPPPEPEDAAIPPEDELPPPDTEPPVDENLDVDGVMMTKPSNMSSESVERILKLAQLLR